MRVHACLGLAAMVSACQFEKLPPVDPDAAAVDVDASETDASGGDGGDETDAAMAVDADQAGPTVESTTPTTDATGVQPEVAITATLSEDLDPTSLTGALTVMAGATAVDGALTANGRTLSFIPTRPLRNPATFTATVTGAKDLAGNTMAPHTWSFTTRPKAWQAPVKIEMADAGSVVDARVAMHAEGDAVVVMSMSDGTRNNTHATRYVAGGSWSATAGLETSSTATSHPRVCLDGSGNAVAVWSQGDVVTANRYIVGTGWGTAASIESRTAGATRLAVACQLNGEAMAVWSENTSPFALVGARLAPGSGWQSPQVVVTPASSSILFTDVSATRNAVGVNTFHTSYSRSDSSTGVYTATAFEGAWSSSTVEASAQAFEVRGGVGRTGPAVTAWQTSGVSSGNIRGARGTTPVALESSATSASVPDVAVNPDGLAVVMWSFIPTTVVAARWTGSAWTAPENVDTTTATGLTLAGAFHTSIDPGGGMIAAWTRFYMAGNRVTVSRRPAGGSWAPAIELGAIGASTTPLDIATDADGNAIVLFLQNTSGRDDLWAAHYR